MHHPFRPVSRAIDTCRCSFFFPKKKKKNRHRVYNFVRTFRIVGPLGDITLIVILLFCPTFICSSHISSHRCLIDTDSTPLPLISTTPTLALLYDSCDTLLELNHRRFGTSYEAVNLGRQKSGMGEEDEILAQKV